ncbi:MAG: hypothetical protein JRE70_02985 [Deltaproteobacteria bacterium]|nr:hypothetical protein [Deltaproteobacteria bacterium]
MIRFVPAEREVRVPSGTSLLEAARLAGLPVARSCVGEATCARCGLQILAGGEALPPESEGERRVKQRNRIDGASAGSSSATGSTPSYVSPASYASTATSR